jgi:hypothetical protein
MNVGPVLLPAVNTRHLPATSSSVRQPSSYGSGIVAGELLIADGLSMILELVHQNSFRGVYDKHGPPPVYAQSEKTFAPPPGP